VVPLFLLSVWVGSMILELPLNDHLAAQQFFGQPANTWPVLFPAFYALYNIIFILLHLDQNTCTEDTYQAIKISLVSLVLGYGIFIISLILPGWLAVITGIFIWLLPVKVHKWLARDFAADTKVTAMHCY